MGTYDNKSRMKMGKEPRSMIDNRIVNENHQQGIARVCQRKEDRNDVLGHNGKMGTIKPTDHFSRKGDALTPRKA